MYKVDEYKCQLVRHDHFTKGQRYYIRTSKNGERVMITTDTHEKVLCDNTLSNTMSMKMLDRDFEYIRSKTFKNYAESKLYLSGISSI